MLQLVSRLHYLCFQSVTGVAGTVDRGKKLCMCYSCVFDRLQGTPGDRGEPGARGQPGGEGRSVYKETNGNIEQCIITINESHIKDYIHIYIYIYICIYIYI